MAQAQETSDGTMRASAENGVSQSQMYLVAVNSIPSPTPEPKLKPRSTARAIIIKPYEEEVKSYIKEVWGANADRAISVARCESGLNPNALNNNPRTGDYSVGVFQINLHGSLATNRPSEEWLRDYKNNVEYAYRMFQSSGWTPWTCAK